MDHKKVSFFSLFIFWKWKLRSDSGWQNCLLTMEAYHRTNGSWTYKVDNIKIESEILQDKTSLCQISAYSVSLSKKCAALRGKRFFCFLYSLCTKLTSLYLKNSGIGLALFIPKYALRMFVMAWWQNNWYIQISMSILALFVHICTNCPHWLSGS